MTTVQPPVTSNSSPLRSTVHDCVTSATRSNSTRPSGAARRVDADRLHERRRRLDDALGQPLGRRDQAEALRVLRVGHELAERVRLPHQLLGARRLSRVALELQIAKGQALDVQRRARRLPAHGVLGHEEHVIRKDLAAAERAHQRFAESPLVGALEVAVGGDHRAQVLAELHVGRRAVVDRADADVEELPGDVARLLRDGFDQRVAERHAAERLRD